MSRRNRFRLQHTALLMFLAVDLLALVAYVVHAWWIPSALLAWSIGTAVALALLPGEIWLVNKVFARPHGSGPGAAT